MIKNTTLQIAHTRFAISCDYPAFTKWLTETCADFLTSGEPHARLSLSFSIVTRNSLPADTSFKIVPRYGRTATDFRVFCPAVAEPERLFRSILQVCLHSSVVLSQSPDLWMHAAGIAYRGKGYVFSGPSGAGKSTVSDILAGEPGFTILHDEIMPLSRSGEGFIAWSSPLRGNRPANRCLGVPLQAIFFLKHAQDNHAVRLSGRKVLHALAASLIKLSTLTDDGRPSVAPREPFDTLLALAERVPCYELHFKPDFSFWECVEQLSAGEYTRA